MEYTDFFLRQIQQIGILIQSLYDKLFKENNLSDTEKIELFKTEFKKIFNINFENIKKYSKNEFEYFLNEKRIKINDKCILAEILFLLSENSGDEYKMDLLEKSLFIYENIINEKPNTYSIKEQKMIALIKEKIG
jgi:hypothetical protein